MANGPRDNDQKAVYLFLKSITQEQGIYLSEMCNDAPLPDLQEISARLQVLNAHVQEVTSLEKVRQSRFKAAQYHATFIEKSHGSENDWQRMIEEIDALVADGVPPSNVTIREMLLPLIEKLPETLPPSAHFQRVLDEINTFIDGQDVEEAAVDRPQAIAIVIAAARMLRGKTVVLIGGERRLDAEERLREQLKLKEVIWIETAHGDSYKTFEPYIARQNVAVVLLAIRWASHSFGETDKLCRKHGKLFVRLPAGYSPNQVAKRIMDKCRSQLQPSVV
jgi:hypothetical protein